ncbi:MAG: ASKHA domain-containing protein [Desulfobacterales bacterium]|jgi:uncharacterized 2Fe-2S/4Fe-4S cluster protein (DUF4445 family)
MKKLPRAKKKKKKGSRTPPGSRTGKTTWLNVLPDDRWIRVKRGITVLEALESAGVDIDNDCGGMGTCGKCKLRVITAIGPPDEQETEQLTAEEIEAGIRLACRTRINKSLVVHTEATPGDMELFQILKHGQNTSVELDPILERHPANVEPPSLAHSASDFFRLRTALGEAHRHLKVTYRCISGLYRALRDTGFSGEALIHQNCLLAWVPAGSRDGRYGVVYDIGTTTLVGKLIDLSEGQEVSVISRLNSQSRFGTNVISRIQFVQEKKNGLKRMREMLIRDLNLITRRLLEANDLAPESIFIALAAGNTTMQHFLLGLDPSGIAEAPFSPVVTEKINFRTEDLGLEMHPDAMLYVMPSKSGYIGGDLISFILSSGAAEEDRMVLGIDFGTNGEIFLGNRRRMLTCSAAAGPALEGARISRGMIARAGAIEAVRVEDGQMQYRVIGNIKAKGICGSGLVDLAAVLLHHGVISAEGLVSPDEIQPDGEILRSRVLWRKRKKAYDFIAVPAEESFDGEQILLTQKDIRELQLAKAAIAAGIEILMAELGVTPGGIDVIYLAGALGNYVNPLSAVRIGLIPSNGIEKIVSLGNAASEGAKVALLSKRHWDRSAEIVDHLEHLELSIHPDFYDRYIAAMNFPTENVW